MANPDPTFLAHCAGDAVAWRSSTRSRGPATSRYLDGTASAIVEVASEIPLGHKVALSDVGRATTSSSTASASASPPPTSREGDYVHIHNVRSARWQNSVA